MIDEKPIFKVAERTLDSYKSFKEVKTRNKNDKSTKTKRNKLGGNLTWKKIDRIQRGLTSVEKFVSTLYKII